MTTKRSDTTSRRRTSRVVAVRASKTAMPGEGTRSKTVDSDRFWRWGDDNRFPEQLALEARRSTTHRRIINDKADYISGSGFTHNGGPLLGALVNRANGRGESLRQVFNRLAFDKALFGNAFVEIITDPEGSFISLHHHDASRCRVAKNDRAVILHHDWTRYRPDNAARVALYPDMETGSDGMLHAMIHYKDYEPMFSHYGVPSYIAGMKVSDIVRKTDQWNIARLDNSFQLSGVMMLDGVADDPATAGEVMHAVEKKFAGQPGQVMFMVRDGAGEDNSRFIPIAQGNEGDWKTLHDQATGDIVVAHSWFRSLSGLEYSGGFSSERIMYEYQIALNTLILPERSELLEPIRGAIRSVTGIDASTLDVINLSPGDGKPAYMKVWEARKAHGLDNDPEAEDQNIYLGQLTAKRTNTVDQ